MTQSPRVIELTAGVLRGNRSALARAITLAESELALDRTDAMSLIEALKTQGGKAIRLGITGAPGVGKSTLIDALGSFLLDRGKKIAVLTVDPSGVHNGGSILGDQIRMQHLAGHERAFVRSSSAGVQSGGVAAATEHSITLCAAAGYDVVIVETVGAGQTERSIRPMVDFLLLLVSPGAGDEVQALKLGLLEVVDLVAITKADGALQPLAEQTQSSYQAALTLRSGGQSAPVIAISAAEGRGLDALWQQISEKVRR
ncbi:MAG TPA: GTP-binding protein [Polyangiaceae bacterium]|nr:GTP-binding protein [Polyangiaceae bacterium]